MEQRNLPAFRRQIGQIHTTAFEGQIIQQFKGLHHLIRSFPLDFSAAMARRGEREPGRTDFAFLL
jgi:hypothetical protein